MFTGIIEGIGQILNVENLTHSLRFWIQTPFVLTQDRIGDSVAVNGCCLTITEKSENQFSCDLSPETLTKTAFGSFQIGQRVNLERALRLGDRLGGHWVQGHVDQVIRLTERKEIISQNQQYLQLIFELPLTMRKYLVAKGSVTLDGVSLTVNEIASDCFSICLIPHTQALTTLSEKEIGGYTHLEVDILAKYVENFTK